MNTTVKGLTIAVAAMAALATVSVGPSSADFHVGFTYQSAPANVQVWLGGVYDYDHYYAGDGRGYGVFPTEDDVVLYVRASRSCFATVYVVDTEGFVHIVHPLTPAHDAYFRGGRVYRFRLGDVGFYGPCFDRGVAYAFAVTSPVPFTYAYYGAGVFGPGIGFRIYGDPYVASRMFYLSILAPGCQRGFVTVGYARFYVREYRPYPVYLCGGWHHHDNRPVHCNGNCAVHRQFRVHASDPDRVINPRIELRSEENEARRYTGIDRTAEKQVNDIRTASAVQKRTVKVEPDNRSTGASREPERRAVKLTADTGRVVKANAGNGTNGASRTTVSPKQTKTADEKNRVVLSTRTGFIKSKNEFSKMREKLADTKTNGQGVKKTSSNRTQVSKRGEEVSRDDSKPERKVAQSSTPARKASSAKRTKK